MTVSADQNIKNKTLASEIDTAYGKYGTWEVHLFLVCKMYKEAICIYKGICLQLTESSMDN